MKRTIQLLRHGATALNNMDAGSDRIRGWMDVPLSTQGVKEAHKLGSKLSRVPPDCIVSSDLKRAYETACIVEMKCGAPLVDITMVFRPWNVGVMAGRLSSEAVPVLMDLAANRPDTKVDGGESFNEFKARYFGGLNATLKKHQCKVAIVTHHRGERLVHAWLAASCPVDGSIDMATFNSKGEHTASSSVLHIPMDRLECAAEQCERMVR